MKEDVVYFSVNNWFSGRDYPNTLNFKKWLDDDLNQTFLSDEWAKENKLCIYYGLIDISHNYTISAPKSWVEKNCPELLTDDEYEYRIGVYDKDGGRIETVKKKYSDFIDYPDEYGDVTDKRFGWPYLEYCKENFGTHYCSKCEEYDDYDDDEDE